ncbi:Gram-negative pili assembly chaperone, C-terminal domain [Ewingella americana]|nr:Gram-negative pili assembly chaperone, C-terminal domain [Ewingella americana]
MTLPLNNARGNTVSWKVINDFGGVSQAETRNL